MDYQNPDYTALIAKRASRLEWLRCNPSEIAACRIHYKTNPWDFVSDWGVTYDPRNLEKGLITNIPFILWKRQREYLQWVYKRWQLGERGLVEKSRDCGVTWLSVGFAVSMWCFADGFTTGFGSRKDELVDKRGDDKSIFQKLRFFIKNLPEEFLPPDYNELTCSSNKRITNPNTGGSIIGESGDEIGRGGRSSAYIVDEAAFIEHQETVDAALSQNTNCQIDISTPNGSGNPFYRKRQRFAGTDKIFIFDWRDDPRKDQAWYDKQVSEQDEVTVAQEIDRNYDASSEDVFIPSKWVKASIDAHIILGFEPEGMRVTAFDPADVGDAKAIANRWGSVITEADMMTKGDITNALPWAMRAADNHRADVFTYDGDGMGAPVMKTALVHLAVGRMPVLVYHGSSSVVDPKEVYGTSVAQTSFDGDPLYLKGPDDPTNKDKFSNYRAQTWTWARDRFKATYDAVQAHREGRIVRFNPAMLVSISSKCTCRDELVSEISRPKRVYSGTGKILVESKPAMRKRQVDSPNLADSVIMALAVRKPEPIQQPKRIRVRKSRDHMRI